MNAARIVVTGEAFVGRGYRSVDAVMDELVKSARSELSVAAYLFTSTRILGKIKRAAQRGVTVSLLANDFGRQPPLVQRELRELVASYPSVRVHNFDSARMGPLHAKVIVSDRSEGIVGSANFTGAAMDKNHEIGVHVRGALAEDLAALLDSLFAVTSAI
jgi:phosphatidylserine/phosphatidylglycerophosphate/cardiolipin synthase-like enzyme